MGIHEYDENMLPDDQFYPGELKYLVKGNTCRYLDGRRTPGIIEEYFEDSAMFRWRITKFEDKGKYWDLPAEKIVKFRFPIKSSTLDNTEINRMKEKIEKFNIFQEININQKQQEETELKIKEQENKIIKWLEKNSQFFNSNQKLDLLSSVGNNSIQNDLTMYMKYQGLYELEKKTAETIVLNPYSGEWMKGMGIVLAEMGLEPYKGKVSRTKEIFEGIGRKKLRRKYLIYRMGFIRAFFHLLGINEVILYRGMSTEGEWNQPPKVFSSWSTRLEVAQSFSGFEADKFKQVYLIKRAIDVNKIFMTFIETKEMNNQYKESEVLLLYEGKEGLL